LVDVGTELLVAELRAGLGAPRSQHGEANYAAKMRPEELQIDWTKPPEEIDRLVRLGGAWTQMHGRRLKVIAADLLEPGHEPSNELRGDRVGGVRLVVVQPEGRAPMKFDDFARGARLADVEPLGATNAGSVSER
jgi:methionyl-tRNA formyltransferase